jgi:hypothetical protein
MPTNKVTGNRAFLLVHGLLAVGYTLMTTDETQGVAEATAPEAGACAQEPFRHAGANLTKQSPMTKCCWPEAPSN